MKEDNSNKDTNQYKGQTQMLEYVLMMVFIVGIVLALIFFLTWWQFSQLNVEKMKNQQDRALSLLKQFIDSPYMTKEDSMFDDAKLTAIVMMDNAIDRSCQRLQDIYGSDWYAEIRLKDGKPDKECTQITFPDGVNDCNLWTICQEHDNAGAKVKRVLPVNIHRNIGYTLDITNAVLPRVFMGTLEVTVYV